MKKPVEILWDIIDEIAARRGVAVSCLAKNAGLDATTFNMSKRVQPNGNARYPSLPTILAVMNITGLDWHDFANLWDEVSQRKGKKK